MWRLAHLSLVVIVLLLGSTSALRAYVVGAAVVSQPTAILDNSAESVYPAENPWLNPESRNGLLVSNDPLDKTDPMGLFRVDEGGNLQPETTREFVQIANQVEHGDVRDTTPLIDPIDILSLGIAKAASIATKAARSSMVAGYLLEGHALDRSIFRNVSKEAIEDALKNPLKVGAEKIDKAGPSVRYVGRKAEVVVNPKTGKIVTVNPTSTKKAERLIRRIDSLIPIREKAQ